MLALSCRQEMVASTEASELLDKSCGFTMKQVENEFPDFADHGDLLDFIDFDDLFGVAGDMLPDLEILSGDHMNASSSSDKTDHSQGETKNKGLSLKGEEVVSKRDDADAVAETDGATDRKIKYSSSKNKEAKRKVKVDWTAELHRRFVEAVEELGVEKAVPSRILELMGVRCLTRHNIASHLQKYRSHRKHSLAREAEAANWTRKHHIYRVDTRDRNKNGWLAPTHTLGFPPRPTVPVVGPPLVHHHNFRPLHVWGHPSVDQSVVWPKHLPPTSASMTNPPFWVSQSPYWHPRFRAPPVAGIPQAMPPHHTVYKPNNGFDGARLPMDFHPSKESVDAAIGEVLTRPWLPLPLGLKPPAVNGVVMELHRHGVSDVLPTESCA